MSKNLYVGNLSYETTSDELRQTFDQYGTVTEAKVVMDLHTGRSRGFGFVEMADGGEEAITALNGSEVSGRTIVVNEAKPRNEQRGGGNRSRGGSDRRY